jgi:hypothetical protein
MSTEVATRQETQVVLKDGEVLPLVITGDAEKDIQNFTTNETEIQKFRDNFLKLEITSLEEKEKYEEIYESRQIVRRARLSVDRIASALNEGAKAYVKKVDARKKELIEKLKPIESHLLAQEERYEALKAEKALELERLAEEVLTNRAAELIDLGCAFTGKYYQIENVNIEHNKISNYSEKEWAALISEIKPIAEAIKKAQMEKEVEAKRMAEELAKEKERSARIEMRTKQLINLGLKYDGENFIFEDVNVHYTELTVLNEEQWKILVERVAPVVSERIAKKEAEERELKLQEEEKRNAYNSLNNERRAIASQFGVDASLMDLASLDESLFNAQVEGWKLKFEQDQMEKLHSARFAQVSTLMRYATAEQESVKDFALMSEQEFSEFKSALELQKKDHEEKASQLEAERKQKEESDRKKREEELAEQKRKEEEARLAAIAPDQTKLADFAKSIRDLSIPELSGGANSKLVHDRIVEQREKFAAWVESQINSL